MMGRLHRYDGSEPSLTRTDPVRGRPNGTLRQGLGSHATPRHASPTCYLHQGPTGPFRRNKKNGPRRAHLVATHTVARLLAERVGLSRTRRAQRESRPLRRPKLHGHVHGAWRHRSSCSWSCQQSRRGLPTLTSAPKAGQKCGGPQAGERSCSAMWSEMSASPLLTAATTLSKSASSSLPLCRIGYQLRCSSTQASTLV